MPRYTDVSSLAKPIGFGAPIRLSAEVMERVAIDGIHGSADTRITALLSAAYVAAETAKRDDLKTRFSVELIDYSTSKLQALEFDLHVTAPGDPLYLTILCPFEFL